VSAVEATRVEAGAGQGHPFRRAMERRDLPALVATLRPDVVFMSPVTSRSFVGLEEVTAVIRVIMDSFEKLEYPDEWVAGSTHIVTFQGQMSGRYVEGCELLRCDEEGRVARIEISARPIAGVMAVASAVGPGLARDLSWFRWACLRLVTKYVPALLHAMDRAAQLVWKPRGWR
jgi:hypothetical protein